MSADQIAQVPNRQKVQKGLRVTEPRLKWLKWLNSPQRLCQTFSEAMFESAKLKLQRADHHVRNFDAGLTDYMDQRPHRPLIKAERSGGNLWRVRIEILVDKEPPPALALIIGDAIHNYRCVLDHLMWELIGIDGGTQDRDVFFPARRTQAEFESAVRKLKTPAPSTKDFIVDLAAYPSGRGKVLYAIHALDNEDKHRVLTPVVQFSYLTDVIDLASGERVPADPIYIGPVGPGGEASFTVPEGFGIDADHRIYPTPDLMLPKGEVFPDEPVTYVLARMSQEVEALIARFEHFVSQR